MNNETLDKIKAKIAKGKNISEEEELQRIQAVYDGLKPFSSPYDVPTIPGNVPSDFYQNVIVKNLIRCGAISKDKLIIGKSYIGDCRNSTKATWNGKTFDYKRYKFGTWFDDEINHFEDDDGYDLFVPIRIVEE